MTMYHVTSPDSAQSIDSEGAFRDGRPTLIGGKMRQGVWISNVILLELWPIVYAIDIDPNDIATFECTDGLHGYREWLVPAAILNPAPRRRAHVGIHSGGAPGRSAANSRTIRSEPR